MPSLPSSDKASEKKSRVEAVQALQAQGITPDMYDDAFEEAICNSDIEQLKLLVAVGINIHTLNDENAALLQQATSSGDIEIIRLLLTVPGIDVNLQDGFGDTALHMAAQEGEADIVELLLAAPGIDINRKNSLDETPLDIAKENDYTGIVEMLINAGGACDESSDAAAAEEEDDDSDDDVQVYVGKLQRLWNMNGCHEANLPRLLSVGEKDCLMFMANFVNEQESWGEDAEIIYIYLKREGGTWEYVCMPKWPHDEVNSHFGEDWDMDELLDKVWEGELITYTTVLNDDYEQVSSCWKIAEE